MTNQSDIRQSVTDFVSHGKALCARMRSADKLLLTTADLHALRIQLQTLDAEAAKLQRVQSCSPIVWLRRVQESMAEG